MTGKRGSSAGVLRYTTASSGGELCILLGLRGIVLVNIVPYLDVMKAPHELTTSAGRQYDEGCGTDTRHRRGSGRHATR